MRVIIMVFGSSLVLALPASAYSGSFALPLWMDHFLTLTLFAGMLAYILTMLTKPADVSLLRLQSVELNPIAGVCYRTLQGLLLVFVALLGLGILLMLNA